MTPEEHAHEVLEKWGFYDPKYQGFFDGSLGERLIADAIKEHKAEVSFMDTKSLIAIMRALEQIVHAYIQCCGMQALNAQRARRDEATGYTDEDFSNLAAGMENVVQHTLGSLGA